MEVNKVIQGDCLQVMKSRPDKSVNCIITSPPYWQLRDYGWDGQWGMEPTFHQYLDNMISFMAEAKRILKDDGTIWVNLGDTYSSNRWSATPSTTGKSGFYTDIETNKQIDAPNKCLLLIPHRFAIRCIDELGLILRNDIIWAKPNGMPESVTDRFSKKHEFFFFFAKNEKYYFDLDSIREKYITHENRPAGVVRNRLYEYDSKMNDEALNPKAKNIKGSMNANGLTRTTAGLGMKTAEEKMNPNGKNPGDVSDFWKIPTKPSSEKHYATYNSQLIDKPIIAGCPEGGIILDPFAGTGTTLARAIQLNRQAIGIEGNSEYCQIAQARIDKELDQLKLAI